MLSLFPLDEKGIFFSHKKTYCTADATTVDPRYKIPFKKCFCKLTWRSGAAEKTAGYKISFINCVQNKLHNNNNALKTDYKASKQSCVEGVIRRSITTEALPRHREIESSKSVK